MIWESYYWREELERLAKDLENKKNIKRWSERSFAKLEKTVFIGFYCIRKLVEASKVSDKTSNIKVIIDAHKWRGKNVHMMNWHKIDELYEMNKQNRIRLSLLRVCGLMIHSFVFTPSFDENDKIKSVLFNSDTTRHKALYCIDIDKIIRLFNIVRNDHPNRFSKHLDEKTGKINWEVFSD